MQSGPEYRLGSLRPDCRSGLIEINEFPKFCRNPARGAQLAPLTFGARLSFCAIHLRADSNLGGDR
jgi:hypothetical protein